MNASSQAAVHPLVSIMKNSPRPNSLWKKRKNSWQETLDMSDFNKPTNPPAFPSSIDDGETVKYMLGISMRDYFAAKALQGIMASSEIDWQGQSNLASSCYEIADAMLKAREEE